MKRLFSWKHTDGALSFALLLFRLVFGGFMIPAGYGKLKNFGTMIAKGKAGDPMGWHSPISFLSDEISLGMLVFAEFFCACLVVVGLLTRLATIPLIIAMSVALFIAHGGRIFDDGSNAAMYLIGFVAILFAGPGKISADRLIGK